VKVKLPYGKTEAVTIDVPDTNVAFIIDIGEVPALKDPKEALRKALKNPIGTPALKDMVNKGDRVVIVGDDATRPTPQKILLPILLDELNAAGVPDEDVRLVVAIGTHRKMSGRETLEVYGGETTERIRVESHECWNSKGLVDIDEAESEVPIKLNRTVYEADFVVGVGNISPHIYAGWGGGGKIILPGVCGIETTAMVHLLGGKTRPFSSLIGKRDNKVRKRIDEVALKAELKLIVNTVLNRDEEIHRIVVGHPVEAFREGVKTAEEVYCQKVPSYVDVAVVSSYPADIDYWQAIKPVVHACLAVKHGGTIVLITPCPEGISPVHTVFRKKAKLGYEANLEAIEKGELEDRVAGGTILLHGQILERVEVVCYSGGLKKSDKEDLGFKHAETPQEAFEMALKSQSAKAKVGVLKCGDVLPKVAF
jgi:nickel-dependent lactate racemase